MIGRFGFMTTERWVLYLATRPGPMESGQRPGNTAAVTETWVKQPDGEWPAVVGHY